MLTKRGLIALEQNRRFLKDEARAEKLRLKQLRKDCQTQMNDMKDMVSELMGWQPHESGNWRRELKRKRRQMRKEAVQVKEDLRQMKQDITASRDAYRSALFAAEQRVIACQRDLADALLQLAAQLKTKLPRHYRKLLKLCKKCSAQTLSLNQALKVIEHAAYASVFDPSTAVPPPGGSGVQVPPEPPPPVPIPINPPKHHQF
jgi:hypothetical protein